MFTVEQRDFVRDRLLSLAAGDPAVVGAAVTGSLAVDGGDRWSDIDLVFGIEGSPGGAHLLPGDVTAPLAATVVRVLDETELIRALDAATRALLTEIAHVDPALSGRLAPILRTPPAGGDLPAVV